MTNDYAQIAQEARAAQDAKCLEMIERRKREAPFLSVLSSVRINLAEEVKRANPELQRAGLLVAEASGGIIFHGQLADRLLHLTYGKSRRCDVRVLDLSEWMLEISMVEGEPTNDEKVHNLMFHLQHGTAGISIQRHAIDGNAAREFEAREIAEIVVAGIIRGQFE